VARVKGTNLISAVKFLRHSREKARALLPAAHHHYLEERVLPTELYPEEDLVELLRAMAELLRGAGGDVYELMGRAAVREQMNGVYEHLLTGDRRRMAHRVAALWQTQHDTGRLVMVDEVPGRARCELSDYGHPTREMCGVIRGYILEALAHSGFASVEVTKVGCVLDGRDRCTWECSWREPGAQRPAPAA
jgi:hypothetical protein